MSTSRPDTPDNLARLSDELGELHDWCPTCLGRADPSCPDCMAIEVVRKHLIRWSNNQMETLPESVRNLMAHIKREMDAEFPS